MKPLAIDAPGVNNWGLKFSPPLNLLLLFSVNSTDNSLGYYRLDTKAVLLIFPLLDGVVLHLINLFVTELPTRMEGKDVKADREIPLLLPVASLMGAHCLCVPLNHENVFQVVPCLNQPGTPGILQNVSSLICGG